MCPPLRRERLKVPSPQMPLWEGSLGFFRPSPLLYPNPPNIYKVLLNHRLLMLSDMLADDPREMDRVITPTL